MRSTLVLASSVPCRDFAWHPAGGVPDAAAVYVHRMLVLPMKLDGRSSPSTVPDAAAVHVHRRAVAAHEIGRQVFVEHKIGPAFACNGRHVPPGQAEAHVHAEVVGSCVSGDCCGNIRLR